MSNDPSSVAAASDCGFETMSRLNNVYPDIVWIRSKRSSRAPTWPLIDSSEREPGRSASGDRHHCPDGSSLGPDSAGHPDYGSTWTQSDVVGRRFVEDEDSRVFRRL